MLKISLFELVQVFNVMGKYLLTSLLNSKISYQIGIPISICTLISQIKMYVGTQLQYCKSKSLQADMYIYVFPIHKFYIIFTKF